MPNALPHPSTNFEFCRKQAKSLLKLAKAQDPAAWERIHQYFPNLSAGSALTLAACQFVIARENGETSWPRLKKRLEQGEPSVEPETPAKLKLTIDPPRLAKPSRGSAMSDAAVQAKTGRTWPEWCALLDSKGAAHMNHQQIVALVKAEGIGSWWQQMVAVGYEQARGLRVINQSCDGVFQVSVSRTIAAPLSVVFEAWNSEKERAKWLPGAEMTIRKANPGKNIRIGWQQGGTVNAMFYEKGGGKCQCVADHTGLKNTEEVERIRAYWTSALERLKALLEA